jgi:predicted TIM-barrel fold metal-dependent hydrolase
MESALRSEAPQLVPDGMGGQQFFIPGMTHVLGLGLLSSAGQPSHSLREKGTLFREIIPAAWEPHARLSSQDADGVATEVLYPSLGLVLFTHINRQYARSCLTAYNRWLSDFCSINRSRLIGLGASAASSPEDMIVDFNRIRQLGLRGVVLPLRPGSGDYSSSDYDPVWHRAVELNLPISFHAQPPEQPLKLSGASGIVMASIWEAQDLLLSLIMGGFFERHPQLPVILAEFDIEWLPHLINRLDHQINRHGHWLGIDTGLSEPASHYTARSLFLTAQEKLASNWPASPVYGNVMWSSDFPHSESTFPNSRNAALQLSTDFPEELQEMILGKTAMRLYGLLLNFSRLSTDRDVSEKKLLVFSIGCFWRRVPISRQAILIVILLVLHKILKVYLALPDSVKEHPRRRHVNDSN